MHKLAATPITLECFEVGDFSPEASTDFIIKQLIPYLEDLRLRYNETKDPAYWKELVRWLPQGWLQTRTWTANYEVIRSMIHQRENHKLIEWRQDFISWTHSLPYSKELLLTI